MATDTAQLREEAQKASQRLTEANRLLAETEAVEEAGRKRRAVAWAQSVVDAYDEDEERLATAEAEALRAFRDAVRIGQSGVVQYLEWRRSTIAHWLAPQRLGLALAELGQSTWKGASIPAPVVHDRKYSQLVDEVLESVASDLSLDLSEAMRAEREAAIHSGLTAPGTGRGAKRASSRNSK
ncbi:MAG: hypothetical protein ACR2I5_03645 [Candidatus Limnocylindria bacterium]